MNAIAKRLLMEANTAAQLHTSELARRVGAREAASIDLADLVGNSAALLHLLFACRHAVIALGLLGGAETRERTAAAIASLVRAARGDDVTQALPSQVRSESAPRLWWLDDHEAAQ